MTIFMDRGTKERYFEHRLDEKVQVGQHGFMRSAVLPEIGLQGQLAHADADETNSEAAARFGLD